MYCGVFGGLGRSKGLSLREKRNRDIYVIHATVCDVSHYWWGSVDVWCGVGNYTALSLDHPISRSDNADYRLIKSCLASSPNHPCSILHCPPTSAFLYLWNCDDAVSHQARCWRRMRRWGGAVAGIQACNGGRCKIRQQKVIKRPAAAAAEPKMQQQCSANLPTCAIFSAQTPAEAKQAAIFQSRIWITTGVSLSKFCPASFTYSFIFWDTEENPTNHNHCQNIHWQAPDLLPIPWRMVSHCFDFALTARNACNCMPLKSIQIYGWISSTPSI